MPAETSGLAMTSSISSCSFDDVRRPASFRSIISRAPDLKLTAKSCCNERILTVNCKTTPLAVKTLGESSASELPLRGCLKKN